MPVRTAILYSLATLLAPAISAQSIDRAIQLFDGAKYAEAKTELVAVQKSDNKNAVAAYYLGRIARIDNDGDEALHQFERAVQHDDRNALYHFWFGTAVSDVGQRLGAAWRDSISASCCRAWLSWVPRTRLGSWPCAAQRVRWTSIRRSSASCLGPSPCSQSPGTSV